MSVSSEMRTLCNHIISASDDRADRLDSLRQETDALRRDAQHMLKGFQKEFCATRADLAAARDIWAAMARG